MACFVDCLLDIEERDDVRNGKPDARVRKRLTWTYPARNARARQTSGNVHDHGLCVVRAYLRPKPKTKLLGRSNSPSCALEARKRSGRNSSGSGKYLMSRVMALHSCRSISVTRAVNKDMFNTYQTFGITMLPAGMS